MKDAKDLVEIEALKSMWPRPRVGERVRLSRGRVGEVITVQKARVVLKNKSELEALMLTPQLQSTFGKHWIEVYYEADVRILGRLTFMRVTTVDVEEVLPPL